VSSGARVQGEKCYVRCYVHGTAEFTLTPYGDTPCRLCECAFSFGRRSPVQLQGRLHRPHAHTRESRVKLKRINLRYPRTPHTLMRARGGRSIGSRPRTCQLSRAAQSTRGTAHTRCRDGAAIREHFGHACLHGATQLTRQARQIHRAHRPLFPRPPLAARVPRRRSRRSRRQQVAKGPRATARRRPVRAPATTGSKRHLHRQIRGWAAVLGSRAEG
jgi:hypothetical protein